MTDSRHSKMADDYRKESRPRKTYIDQNLVRVQREARARMEYMLEHGSEAEFVEALKRWMGEKLTPELLKHCIRQFHASRAEKRGL